MSARICMCCGEQVGDKGNALSRNPNLCASCSSISDGISESNVSSFSGFDDKMLVTEDYSPSHGQTRQSVRP
jgi:hypothetical protein